MTERPLGLILAGGLARRMGGRDKALIDVGGKSILDRVIERLAPQCSRLVISANGDLTRFARAGLPVISDDIPGFAGPLAGILTGLEWAAANSTETEYIVSVAGDYPFLPRDLVRRLQQARAEEGKPLACAQSGDWRHPVAGLWPIALRKDLRYALMEETMRKIEVWTARHGVGIAEWPDHPFDPFFNANTPEDIDRAREIARIYPDA